MKDKKRKMEFSKKIVIVFTILEVAVVAYTCVLMWITKDLSPLAYLLPSVSAVGAAGVAFYYNKAKLENKIKLMHHYGVAMTEQSFNDYNYGG